MVDAATSQFVMYGARDAIAGGLVHIEEQVKGIELAVLANPALAFDLAKTVVESTCRAVLGERSISFNDGDDLPKLFKAVSTNLPFLPPTANDAAETRKSLAKTLNGLSTAIQGICELRNQCGFASHGSGTARPAMESVQALLAAEAADAIVGFLHRVHRQNRPSKTSLIPAYKDSQSFNDHVDEAHGPLRIFEVELRPSEVLYAMEPESYRVYLAEFEPDGEAVSRDAATDEKAEGAA